VEDDLTTLVRTEKRKRGVVGKFFLLIFWAFNGLMAIGLFRGLSSTGKKMAEATTEAQQAGTAIGAVLGTGMILAIWMAGAVILGLFVLLTPGKTVITETTKD
jgi:hypothetical protein